MDPVLFSCTFRSEKISPASVKNAGSDGHCLECLRLYHFDIRKFLLHQLLQRSEINIPGHWREGIVKMRKNDAFRLKDRQDLAGAGRQIIIPLVWKDQDIRMLRVGFLRVKCQAPQKQDFTPFRPDIICHDLPCFLEGPVCPE